MLRLFEQTVKGMESKAMVETFAVFAIQYCDTPPLWRESPGLISLGSILKKIKEHKGVDHGRFFEMREVDLHFW